MPKPVVNVDELTFSPRHPDFSPKGNLADRFEVQTARVAGLIGARKLGYNVTMIPPGKAAYPFHSHRTNEEMFFVLQGTGEIRFGSETYPIRAGDFIACPVRRRRSRSPDSQHGQRGTALSCGEHSAVTRDQ